RPERTTCTKCAARICSSPDSRSRPPHNAGSSSCPDARSDDRRPSDHLTAAQRVHDPAAFFIAVVGLVEVDRVGVDFEIRRESNSPNQLLRRKRKKTSGNVIDRQLVPQL